MTRRRRSESPRHRRHRYLRPVDEPEGPDDLLRDVAARLADPEPLIFLGLASAIVSSLDPRSLDPTAHAPDAAMLVESFIDYSVPQTTALLLALAQLLPDNHLAQQARREARRRDHPLPEWLLWLDEAEPGPAAASVDVLGDGQNTIVSARLTGGMPLTALVFIDHNLGAVAKDGFVLATDLDTLRRQYSSLADEPESIRFLDLDPAEARAQITQAIETGAMMVPTFEGDTWPAARPLVEWMIGLLPGGGTGFVRPEWSDEDRDQLADWFLDSDDGAHLTDADARIADSLLWFTTDYVGSDPWRWSPVNVEILLARWYDRKVMDSVDGLAAVRGEEALAELDTEPLPDEPFRWTDIPADIHERVGQILALCDGCADELFDVEVRTAFRRVLARTAAAEPAVFRRRSKNETAAAAIAWTVGSANELVGAYRNLTAKELFAHFGVPGSVSDRARPFVRAFGVDEWFRTRSFGTPEVLTSGRRTQLIEIRDREDGTS